jgi:DNA polymerase-3 subunit beta
VKFICEREALTAAVGAAHRAVASRTGALPVLSGVQVTFRPGEVEFTGSDLELTIRSRVKAQVEGEGSAVLVARLLVDTLAKLSEDTVSVEIVEDQAKIECGRFRSEVRTLAAADFPRLPDPEGEAVTVDGAPFAQGLRQVVPAASRDDARPILTGVLIASTGEGVRLVATDSYRLAVADLPGITLLPENKTVLVGAKGLSELQRFVGDGAVEVYLGDRYVTFRLGATELTARLIEGEFPNYQQLIPAGYPNKLTVDRDALAHAVERVSLVGGATRDSSPIKLTMTADGLELSANAQDVGQSYEPVEAKFEGSDVTVAFNARFLLEGVEATGSSEITIETMDPLKPAVLRGANTAGFLYLLMPVRIA